MALCWWKKEMSPEEAALTQAAMRLRMEINNLGSASPNRIDRAWASVIAESLDLSGYRLERIERPPIRDNRNQNSSDWMGTWKQ